MLKAAWSSKNPQELNKAPNKVILSSAANMIHIQQISSGGNKVICSLCGEGTLSQIIQTDQMGQYRVEDLFYLTEPETIPKFSITETEFSTGFGFFSCKALDCANNLVHVDLVVFFE